LERCSSRNVARSKRLGLLPEEDPEPVEPVEEDGERERDSHAAVVMCLLRDDSSAVCLRLTATGEGVRDGDTGEAAERERRVGAGDDMLCEDLGMVLMENSSDENGFSRILASLKMTPLSKC
jgi:hypothetical protein